MRVRPLPPCLVPRKNETLRVIDETHESWSNLVLRKAKAGKLVPVGYLGVKLALAMALVPALAITVSKLHNVCSH